MTDSRRTVAFFDFDGTVVKGDSVLPFSAAVVGWPRIVALLLSNLPLLYRCYKDRDQRDLLKARIAALTFADRSVDEIDLIAKPFAEKRLHDTFPRVMERLEWHRTQGHELVFVTASFESYMKHVGDSLGLDHVAATKIGVVNNVYTGDYDGKNVRAAEKARAVSAYLEGSQAETWAYGNSADDRHMLALSTHPFYVDKQGELAPWSPT